MPNATLLAAAKEQVRDPALQLHYKVVSKLLEFVSQSEEQAEAAVQRDIDALKKEMLQPATDGRLGFMLVNLPLAGTALWDAHFEVLRAFPLETQGYAALLAERYGGAKFVDAGHALEQRVLWLYTTLALYALENRGVAPEYVTEVLDAMPQEHLHRGEAYAQEEKVLRQTRDNFIPAAIDELITIRGLDPKLEPIQKEKGNTLLQWLTRIFPHLQPQSLGAAAYRAEGVGTWDAETIPDGPQARVGVYAHRPSEQPVSGVRLGADAFSAAYPQLIEMSAPQLDTLLGRIKQDYGTALAVLPASGVGGFAGGAGLATSKPVARGEVFAVISGDLLSADGSLDKPASCSRHGYCFPLWPGSELRTTPTRQLLRRTSAVQGNSHFLGGMANDAVDLRKSMVFGRLMYQPGVAQNADFLAVRVPGGGGGNGGALLLSARADIAAGEEILLDYGSEWWEKRYQLIAQQGEQLLDMEREKTGRMIRQRVLLLVGKI